MTVVFSLVVVCQGEAFPLSGRFQGPTGDVGVSNGGICGTSSPEDGVLVI